MIFYTADRKYNRTSEIDTFVSGIWTERYYGDSEFELSVPATKAMIKQLPEGGFLAEEDSDELMSIENAEIKEGILKVSGISVLPWMNNRFIRSSPLHEEQYWTPSGGAAYPGWVMWALLYYWCVDGPYLNGTTDMGIPNPQRLKIPIKLTGYTQAVPKANFQIEYGPVYDRMKEVGTTYEIGMKITLDKSDQSLHFLSYIGRDRTSRQSKLKVVRFSVESNALSDATELRSIQNLKTLVYSFAPSDPGGLTTVPGSAQRTVQSGFDLRALQTFEDFQDDAIADYAMMTKLLNDRAKKALRENSAIKGVDGQISTTLDFRYKRDFNLGDLVEMQGPSGIITIARVTEFIRSHDSSGEKAYPTVELLE